jgi:hypothetical protein
MPIGCLLLREVGVLSSESSWNNSEYLALSCLKGNLMKMVAGAKNLARAKYSAGYSLNR